MSSLRSFAARLVLEPARKILVRIFLVKDIELAVFSRPRSVKILRAHSAQGKIFEALSSILTSHKMLRIARAQQRGLARALRAEGAIPYPVPGSRRRQRRDTQ